MKLKFLFVPFLAATLALSTGFTFFSGKGAHAETQVLPKLKEGDPLPNDLFVKLAKAVNPAVVNINTSYLPKRPQMYRGGRPMAPNDPIFELFEQFMMPMPQQAQPSQSLGTGFIIREDGLILTNNHVVENADEIKVTIEEGSKESFDAKVIGTDPRTDIALIKINTKRKLSVAKLGSSGDLQVGEWVAAFGNPYGHGHSMSKGIVSAIGREIEELNMLPFIQTDASINPGNSGGPLVNTQGLVVGVNTAIDARAQGIGFAIPIDQVKDLIPQLEKNGEIRRGFLGVGLQELDPQWAEQLGLKDGSGALITQVMDGSAADKAGVKAYDVITKFNNEEVEDPGDLSRAVAKTKIGQQVNMELIRDGKKKTLKVKIGKNSGEQQARNDQRDRRSVQPSGKSAPYNLGFEVVDYNPGLAKRLGLGQISSKNPIVVDVDRGSPAAAGGLTPGDVILDVNKKPTKSVNHVMSALKKKGNILRVFKQGRVVLIGV
ncbi:MAG: serine protease MucD [Bdellovibrionaceae bacterium]|nr:serine protease MucD [Pseudobdellovibrionaceae bacterium]|tara:strand:- start:22094 stop:23560 length:1467 start_codon:yes stop_codon:yes gene_type:complete